MPVTSSPVEIVIRVVDGNSGEVISQIEKNLKGVGSAGATTGATAAKAMRGTADGAAAAGGELKKLEKEFTGGESSLRTMNTEVRSLQGSLYGDSRAAAEFLAMFPKLGEAMELAFPIFGLVAFVGVIAQAVEKVHELYEKYLNVDGATEEYNKQLEKTRQEDFGNTRSIEDTTARIKEATQALQDWQTYKEQQHHQANSGLGLISLGDFVGHTLLARQADDKMVEQRKTLQALAANESVQVHQGAQEQIALNHALDGELQGRQKILMNLAKQRSLHAEEQDFDRRQAGLSGNLPSKDFGESERNMKDAIAEKEAEAELFNLQRQNGTELRHLQEAAVESRLKGTALYEAQERAAIEDLKDKDMDSVAARNAIHEKFHNEEMRRIQAETDATQLIQARAAMAGMTGIQKTQAEGDIQIAQIRGDNDLSDNAKNARIAAAQQTTQTQILTDQRAFTQQIDQIVDQSATHQISGFARIGAEEAKQLADLKKKFDDTYGHMDMAAPGAAGISRQGQADYQRGVAAIHGGSDFDRAELARNNAEQTAEIEAQARIRFLSSEKQKTAAIDAEYEERTRKLYEQLKQQEIGWDDYNRRVSAAAQQRDGEMVQAATEAREKMAHEFDSVFRGLNHPMQMLQELGAKAASEAAATMVQRYQMRHQHGGQETLATGPGGIFGSIFGHKHSSTGVPELLAGAPGSTHEAAGKNLAIAAAQIQIGSAQIAFAGGLPSSGGITGVASASSRGMGFVPSSASDLGGFLSGGGFSGGAGSGGMPESPAHTTGGVMPSQGGGASAILGNLQQGLDLATQAKSIFGGKSSKSGTGLLQPTDPDIPDGTLNADGTYTSGKGGGMLQGGGFKSNALGAASGALGMYGAVKSNGGFSGAASGAMSGMELGMALGGPVGAAVGAAAGAIVGAIGFGGREKAHVYDLKNVRPRIQTDQLAYNAGSMDYMSAYSDMQALDMEAKKTTNSMGPAAKSYYKDTIEAEIHNAAQRFTREEKAGRSMYTATSAQYATGIDFVPRTEMALIHRGERVVRADQNERITQALEGGAMVADSGPSDVHLHFHAHDSKTAMQFLMDNKHVVRSALNASYSENSGGADA